jgi:hypothetical protein
MADGGVADGKQGRSQVRCHLCDEGGGVPELCAPDSRYFGSGEDGGGKSEKKIVYLH